MDRFVKFRRKTGDYMYVRVGSVAFVKQQPGSIDCSLIVFVNGFSEAVVGDPAAVQAILRDA